MRDARPVVAVFCLYTCLCMWVQPLYCGEKQRAQVILDLNCDCIEDTVIVQTSKDEQTSKIKRIAWGARTRSNGCDTAWYSGRSSQFRNSSRIDLPAWANLRTSLSRTKINEDSYPDLVVTVRGHEARTKVRTRFQLTDTAMFEVDTSFTFVIYAQRGLDSLAAIDVTEEIGNQPFTAKRLRFDQDFEDRQLLRSGFTVGRLLRSTDETNVPASALVANTGSANQTIQLDVYPNPNISGLVNVRVVNSLSEDCNVVIRNAIGQVVASARVHSIEGVSLQTELMLPYAPSGVYSVQVVSSDHRIRQSRLLSVVR